MKLSELRQKYIHAPKRPKGLRFFDELSEEAKEFAIENEKNSGRRFDDDDALFLTEDFHQQLNEKVLRLSKSFGVWGIARATVWRFTVVSIRKISNPKMQPPKDSLKS